VSKEILKSILEELKNKKAKNIKCEIDNLRHSRQLNGYEVMHKERELVSECESYCFDMDQIYNVYVSKSGGLKKDDPQKKQKVIPSLTRLRIKEGLPNFLGRGAFYGRSEKL